MIEEKLKNQFIQIGERIHTIQQIILFGSRAVGDYQEKSDIDLAFVAPKMTEEEWTKLTFSMEDELDTLLLLDLVKYESASEELKKEIMKTGKLLYASKK